MDNYGQLIEKVFSEGKLHKSIKVSPAFSKAVVSKGNAFGRGSQAAKSCLSRLGREQKNKKATFDFALQNQIRMSKMFFKNQRANGKNWGRLRSARGAGGPVLRGGPLILMINCDALLIFLDFSVFLAYNL